MKTIVRCVIQYPLAVMWLGVALLVWPITRLFDWAFDMEPTKDWRGFALMGFHLHEPEKF